jgi:hypothetical protein
MPPFSRVRSHKVLASLLLVVRRLWGSGSRVPLILSEMLGNPILSGPEIPKPK